MYIRKGTESHPTLTVRIKNELIQEERQSRAKFTIFNQSSNSMLLISLGPMFGRVTMRFVGIRR